MPTDATLNVPTGNLAAQSMRYHELHVQRWLNRIFLVREGFSQPVVFGAPMDAFSHFADLWAQENNPFAYLLQLKDEAGTPLYEPHPAPVRYPVISVFRKGWKLRAPQNFSTYRWRRINWPTVSDDVTRCDLGNVTTSRMPMAWDYRFQIDHFCMRPDSQAFFVDALMNELWRSGGPTAQTWVRVEYPGWGPQSVRLYLDGDIESTTPEEPQDGKNVEYRTTFNIAVEGFKVDLNFEIFPALWTLILRSGPADPSILESFDLRIHDENVTLNARANVPSDVECAHELETLGQPELFTIAPDTIAPATTFGVPTVS